MSTRTPAVSVRHVSKQFGRHAALTDVDVDIFPGEMVGLLGPNGAGKSTLVKILDGVHAPTSGQLLLEGRPVSSLSGQPAVGFVHQDLGLIDQMSIVENLRLGEPALRLLGPVLSKRAELDAAAQALETVELDLPVRTLVGELSPAEKALVAMARAFHRGARIMFVDEVTSTLPPGDARRVTQTLRRSAERGATIVMITHKLSEVLDSTSRIVLLIDGRVAADRQTAGLDHAGLTDLLLAHEQERVRVVTEGTEGAERTDGTRPAVAAPLVPSREGDPGDESGVEAGESGAASDVLVRLEGVHRGVLGPIDLDVRAGEVLGVGGLPGSGLHDLAFLVHRETRPTRGHVHLAPGAKTALVPPHRETQGGFDDHTVRDNMAISALRRMRGGWRAAGLLSRAAEHDRTAQMATVVGVDPPDPDYRFGALSGGNKQKVIFGRALLSGANVFVLCEPTRGVDVKTRREIYALIGDLKRAGSAVLVLSSDAEDLFSCCDRVSVIFDGVLGPARPTTDMTNSDLEALL